MGKDAYYFKHDYNARGDEKIIKLLRVHGLAGYGCYWCLIEKLYESDGRIAMDAENLAFDLRCSLDFLKAVIDGFGLFFVKNGKLGSHSVDRRLQERRGKSEQARRAALAGVALRVSPASAQRPLSVRELGEERKGENKRKEEKREDMAPYSPLFCTYNDKGQGACSDPVVNGSRFCEGHKIKVRDKFLDKQQKKPPLPELKSFS